MRRDQNIPQLPITELKFKHTMQKCLIIGGGHSVKNFDFNRLPKGFITIVPNDTVHLPEKVYIDYNIYREDKYLERLEKRIVNEEIDSSMVIIGHTSYLSKYADYYYDHNIFGNVTTCHSGADSLFIADHIFSCKEVYLIGFDYNVPPPKENQSEQDIPMHYYGNDEPKAEYYRSKEERRMFKKALFQRAIKDFDKCEWSNKVFNCNEGSNLKKFPFKLPYKGDDIWMK